MQALLDMYSVFKLGNFFHILYKYINVKLIFDLVLILFLIIYDLKLNNI